METTESYNQDKFNDNLSQKKDCQTQESCLSFFDDNDTINAEGCSFFVKPKHPGCGVVAAVGRDLLRLLCCGCVTLLWFMFCMALSRRRISYFGIGKTSGGCMIILKTR